MPPTPPQRKLRSSAKSYPIGVRWAIDYPPEYLKKLRETDPAAYEYLLKFIEAEYGGRPDAFYSDPKEHTRCYEQAHALRDDILSNPPDTIRVGTEPTPVIDTLCPMNNPEDAIAALIDRRHVLSAPWRDKVVSLPEFKNTKRRLKRKATRKKRRSKTTSPQ